ncbi:hypothetical protein H4J02_13790 [Protaetiibacter sp. SSC-01]|uniref:DUF6049 family protein n=1 Tax=Protaetiibacter sp. SSC-01 TaxID=2759943 RepID=UPI001657161A|nr:DUF6049 family protein [Protaetiibacter sp. SSC-01]QNO37470.1 hypothetical protein H4J02_13790 [Protaetiibacter sp. SSC-01]
MTTRRAARALAAAVVAAALGVGSAAGATAASGPRTSGPSVSPASAEITPGSGPVSVAVVVPISVPAPASGLLSSEALERYTGPFGSLTRQLDAVAGTPAAIALDPMIAASIRVLGSSAPATATQWLARLEATSNEVFLLAYADADLVAAARTGTVADLTPSGFGFALDEANFSPAVTPAPTDDPTATPTADPDAPPPFPTTDDVLAWSTGLPRIAWPDAAVGAADLPAIAAAGYEHVLVSSASVGEPGAPLVDLDGIRGIVADAALTTLLADAVSAASPSVRTTAVDALDAELGARTVATPGRGLVLTVDRGWNSTSTGLAEVLARLASTSNATAVPLADILTTTPASARLGDGTATTDSDAVFSSLAADAAAETAFSSVLSDPRVLLDPRRLERISLYSLSWRSDVDEWGDEVQAFHDRSAEILTSVKLEQGSEVALLARNVDLKVTVSNALPFPVTVIVTADPRSPILRARETRELTIEPQSTGTARIPVEAIANGEVTVTTSIASPTGVPIDAGLARVTVRAEWEGIGTLAVVILLALVFAAGLVRLVIVRRRARRARAEDADG